MGALFLQLINMSIAAGWLVLAVLILRLLPLRIPKSYRCILWVFVAVRLICPISAESMFSLLPSARTLPQRILTGPSFYIHTGIAVLDNPINEYLGDRYFEGVSVPAGNGRYIMTFFAFLWLAGILAVMLYSLAGLRRLRRLLQFSVPLASNTSTPPSDAVRICDYISEPFIFGVFRPRIYIPSNLDPSWIPYVLAHERMHIKRHDHWQKLLGFLLLAAYWFHPLMWAAYIFFCRDMELACDEAVIKDRNMQDRKNYAYALLACSAASRSSLAVPLAFGEIGVKERIRSVLAFQRPSPFMAAAAWVICIAAALCFLTNPRQEGEPNLSGVYESPGTVLVTDDV